MHFLQTSLQLVIELSVRSSSVTCEHSLLRSSVRPADVILHESSINTSGTLKLPDSTKHGQGHTPNETYYGM